jgi:hypothetical protein
MERNSVLTGIAFMLGVLVLSTAIRVFWRIFSLSSSGRLEQHQEVLSRLPGVVLVYAIILVPLATVVFCGDYISDFIKASLIILVIAFIISWSIYIWYKYRRILPKDYYGKKSDEENKSR